MKEKLSKPPFVIIFALCTLFLSNLVYIYFYSVVINKDADEKQIYPLRELILTIITFGIYGIFWVKKISKSLDKIDNRKNETLASILLSVVFLKCLSLAIICDRIEKIKLNQKVNT